MLSEALCGNAYPSDSWYQTAQPVSEYVFQHSLSCAIQPGEGEELHQLQQLLSVLGAAGFSLH